MAKKNPIRKREKGELEHDLTTIARLYAQGKTQREIAQYLNDLPNRAYTLTQQQISYDLNKVLAEWRKARIEDMNDLKLIELQRLNRIEAEAWDAWERSKETRTESTSKVKDEELSPDEADAKAKDPEKAATGLILTPDGIGVGPNAGEGTPAGIRTTERTEKVVQRDGNPIFLQLALQTSAQRVKILGLEAPKGLMLMTDVVVGLED